MEFKKKDRDKLEIAASKRIKERNFWLNQLKGNPVKTGFPFDYEKRKGDENHIKELAYGFRFPGEIFSKLTKLSRGSDYTLSAILVAGLVVLLNKYTDSQDIIIGTPIYKQEIETDFINTVLVLRIQVRENMTFRHLLLQVSQTIMEATENYSYPLEILPEKLNIPYRERDFPFIDIAVLLENIHSKEYLRHINRSMTFSFLRKENSLEGTLEYKSLRYKQTTIEVIIIHYLHLMESALSNIELEISEVNILSEEEKKRILYDFNDTETELGNLKDKPVHQLFEEQVEQTPHHAVVVGASIHTPHRHLISYKELNKKSNQLAAFLRSKGVEPGTVVGVMVGRTIEMMLAILGIMKAGGAYLPIDPVYPKKRIKYILADSRASLILTNKSYNKLIGKECETLEVENNTWYKKECDNLKKIEKPTDLVYVIYTSGSTGRPKGVMIQHYSLVNFIKGMTDIIDCSTSDTILSLTTLSFDIFGLETLLPLAKGSKVVMGNREEQLDPQAAALAISKEKVTIFQLTPSRLSILISCQEFIRCLKSLRCLLVGGETLPEELLKKVQEIRENRIYNVYGPTETTIWSTLKDVSKGKSLNIGKPIANTLIYILDKHQRLQFPGAAGELYIGGAGLACGYINNPELTAEKFIELEVKIKIEVEEGETSREHMSYFYKTGDFAKWLPDGNIEFLGRMDHQLKIRGFRIELGEIENRLLTHERVKETVVLAQKDKNGDNYLCAYIVSDGEGQLLDYREFLLRYLPDYMVPLYFVQVENIPLNPNGKVDRKALPVPVFTTAGRYVPPGNEIEEKLVEIWAEILSLEKEEIGIDANFLQLGGHSLKAHYVAAQIHKTFDVKLPLVKVFEIPTIRGLAEYIKGTTQHQYTAIPPVERKEYYELSSAEKRLFILNEIGDVGIVYNLPAVWMMEGILDKQRLEDVFAALIKRHEVLRTSFTLMKGKPVQIIHDQVEFQIQSLSMNTDTWHQQRGDMVTTAVEKFIKPFDLSRAPLLRVALMRLEEEKLLIIFDMHHIITDGVSMGIFLKEFMALYREVKLPLLRIHYKDFSQWQTSGEYKVILDKQESYWLDRFKDGVPILDFPADYPRPPVQSYKGDCFHFTLNEVLSGKLKQLNQETETTLNMVLLAVYTILLSKYSGQEDVVVGLGIAGRTHPDQGNMIGFFVNTIAIRNQPKKDLSFGEFLKQVKKNTLKGYENQDYPFEEMVNKLGIPNDLSRNPLFDVAFVVQNMDLGKIEIENLKMIPAKFETNVSRFDLQLAAREVDDTIALGLEYSTALFKRTTAQKFAERYVHILNQVVDNSDIKLEDITLFHELAIAKSNLLQTDTADFGF